MMTLVQLTSCGACCSAPVSCSFADGRVCERRGRLVQKPQGPQELPFDGQSAVICFGAGRQVFQPLGVQERASQGRGMATAGARTHNVKLKNEGAGILEV